MLTLVVIVIISILIPTMTFVEFRRYKQSRNSWTQTETAIIAVLSIIFMFSALAWVGTARAEMYKPSIQQCEQTQNGVWRCRHGMCHCQR